jgi:hypothetical protein
MQKIEDVRILATVDFFSLSPYTYVEIEDVYVKMQKLVREMIANIRVRSNQLFS